ncbi:NRDE family protein [Planococcus sp. ISL-109]|uniref:NRDE family protein n=1 Tax=Planococcus sp. ISL-109 TaxID=2819166 RepID=UPI001BE4F975|nr:NRDE family protein [Planococcus sp. ISL-109]MBT2581581.1 NRDE family protein [Planococcus sp. ISL-109]
MCLINLQFQHHPRYKLIVAANRDEFYGRPAAPAHFWKDAPAILAGRDLSQMGTWLGVNKSGRFAALTNYRDPEHMAAGARSRGELVTQFLEGHISPEAYLQAIDDRQYAGFNLIAGDAEGLYYYNNIHGEPVKVPPGTHGLSNHFLNTPWPKVERGKEKLEAYVSLNEDVQLDRLFEILADAEQASDDRLPQTGVGLELERALSPMFIKMPDYGTRSATVLLIDHEGLVTFAERSYLNGEFREDRKYEFQIS